MAEQRSDAKALRALPAADPTAQVEAIRRERWEHRAKIADGSVRQTHRLRILKRQLARVLTVLHEQQVAQAKGQPR